jgi:plastocyanin
MNKIIKTILFVLMGMFVVATAYSAETKEVYQATIDSSGVQKVEMLAGSYFFKPNDVIVKVNVPVEISIKKESGFVPHNIVLHAPEAGVDFDVDLGKEPKVIKFTPTKTGKYPFYCSKRFLFWTHRDKGMEGVLEVTE